jgi:hypothetical protein
MCENCHDIYTLHTIQEHVTTNNIYTVNGVLNQTVYCEEGMAWKCVACHGNNLDEAPPETAPTPTINNPEPNFGSAGIIADLTPSSNDFGLKETGDKVLYCVTGCGVSANWKTAPTYAWDEHLIRFRIPPISIPDNLSTSINVKVHKENGVADSNWVGFTVRKHPEIAILAPSSGTYGTTVTIQGKGYGTQQEQVFCYVTGCYGYSSYVELAASNDRYRVKPSNYTWTSTTSITAVLNNLLDVYNNAMIPPSLAYLLFTGNWNVTFVTDYFKDDGDGVYMDANGRLDLSRESLEQDPRDLADGPNGTGTAKICSISGEDCSVDGDCAPDGGTCTVLKGDTLLWRERSDPKPFTVNYDPYITKINSTKIHAGDLMKIIGVNFGTTKGTSKVRVGKCAEVMGDTIAGTTIPVGNEDGKCDNWAEIVGDGRGNDNGKCEAFESCMKEVCFVKVSGSKIATVRKWGTTKVVAKVPNFGASKPVTKCVQINRSDGVKSNAVKIKILP